MSEELIKWLIIGLVVLAQAILVALKIIEKRNGKNTIVKYNPHPPGESQTCRDHGEAIASIKTDIVNIKDDIRRIERKINGAK